MSDEEAADFTRGEQTVRETPEFDPTNVPIRWRDTPTVVVDSVVGFAAADGLARITLGELVYNPGTPLPAQRAAITLAMTGQALGRLQLQLADIMRQLSEDDEGDQDGAA